MLSLSGLLAVNKYNISSQLDADAFMVNTANIKIMRSLSSIAHWYVAAEKIRRSFEAICLYNDTVATGDKDVTGCLKLFKLI
ncbi:MAG: hypothetical protein PUP93_34530 [Rhizonema sp. NSF051]|nr:hypothetical protein [Rhizonema sp. NSF051]